MISVYPEASMRSLTALISETAADDPLARAFEAVLNSGLIVFTRDTKGRMVQLSEVLTDRAGIVAGVGDSQPRNLRVFDEHGRLLPGSEYPAAITRVTGNAQRDVLFRLVSEDDREIWLKMSTLPLERGPEGWSVLTLATDVTDLREELEAAKREIAARWELLALSAVLATRRLSHDELLDAFRGPLETLLPGANVFIVRRDGDEYETTPLVDSFGEPLGKRRGRHMAEQRERWQAPRAHVNLDVQDTDIYGGKVVVEFIEPFRSIIIAPCVGASPERPAAIAALAPIPAAFTEDQIAGLEFAARLIASALEAAEPLAQAS